MALPLSYNIRSLVVRWKVTLLAIFGIGCVVTVFVVLLAMLAGFRLALRSTGSPDNAIVVQRGSGSELTSFFSGEAADIIAADARVARAAPTLGGAPLASREIVIIANLPRRVDGAPTNVTIRGVSPLAFQVRRGISIHDGRSFKPGLNEVIVGQRIAERVRGLEIGARLSIQKRDWEVVGHFRADGSSFESEIWGDLDVMAPAFQRAGGQNSMTVRLADPAALKAFDESVQADPRFQVHLVQEQQYYEDQAGTVAGSLLALAGFVAIVMGTGAIFGAMNTMYAIVAARTREIGTLRALGFSRLSILTAFVLESLLLGLAGGILGGLLSLAANGYTTATGQTSSFSELAFAFQITPANLTAGVVFALLMGFLGGLLPAWRAARLAITSALREA
jgi:putative ABC transport system permease protein